MKRLTPVRQRQLLPVVEGISFGKRKMFNPTVFSRMGGDQFRSSCLACEDQPCVRFADDELSRSARIDTPFMPDSAVCPVDAITRQDSGVMNVDDTKCIGCGLCVVRCPVGAISLDPVAGGAIVVDSPDSNYQAHSGDAFEFTQRRDQIEAALDSERAPFDDAGRVCVQVKRMNSRMTGAVGQRAFRLLVRNSFLVCGAVARLKIAGDNNAACELLVDVGVRVRVTELEAGVDTLDALRRAVAGTAVLASRYGLNLPEVSAIIVVKQMPNSRVDYYNFAKDVKNRLGLKVATIPIGLLLLLVRSGGDRLESVLSSGAGDDQLGWENAVKCEFGDVQGWVEAGLRPAK